MLHKSWRWNLRKLPKGMVCVENSVVMKLEWGRFATISTDKICFLHQIKKNLGLSYTHFNTVILNTSSFSWQLNEHLPHILSFLLSFGAAGGFHNGDPLRIHVCLHYLCLQQPDIRLLRFSLHCHSCDPGEVQCGCLGNHSDPCYRCGDSVNMGKWKWDMNEREATWVQVEVEGGSQRDSKWQDLCKSLIWFFH